MGRTYLLKILWAMIAWLFLGDEPRHTCRMFLGRWEPTSLRRCHNDQNTLRIGQKHHFYATILARRCQNGPRRRQTLKSGEPRSPDPGVSTGMLDAHRPQIGSRRSLATNRRRSGGYTVDIHRRDSWFSSPAVNRRQAVRVLDPAPGLCYLTIFSSMISEFYFENQSHHWPQTRGDPVPGGYLADIQRGPKIINPSGGWISYGWSVDLIRFLANEWYISREDQSL